MQLEIKDKSSTPSQIRFVKATAQWASGDYEDLLAQVCNYLDAKLVKTSVATYIRWFGEPERFQANGDQLLIWHSENVRLYCIDFAHYRIRFYQRLQIKD